MPFTAVSFVSIFSFLSSGYHILLWENKPPLGLCWAETRGRLEDRLRRFKLPLDQNAASCWLGTKPLRHLFTLESLKGWFTQKWKFPHYLVTTMPGAAFTFSLRLSVFSLYWEPFILSPSHSACVLFRAQGCGVSNLMQFKQAVYIQY